MFGKMLTGLQFVSQVLDPFLKTGETLAFFRTFGKISVSTASLKF